ncbi:MAG: hypothetical protein ACQETI_13515 [Halobacteriota archaeon]
MTETAQDRPVSLDLTHEEAWVVHVALLADIQRRVERGEAPWREWELRTRVESGDDAFDREELRTLKRVLSRYAQRAPERDLQHVQAVLDYVALALS